MKMFDGLKTDVWLDDTSKPRWDGDVRKKQNLYFGCNYDDIPTIIIKWAETSRGFGEYVFQRIDDQMICHSEFDSRETVKRILCEMVDRCVFTDEPEKAKTLAIKDV